MTVPANATSVNVAITAVALGSTTNTASAAPPGIANATLNVTVQSAGAILVPSNTSVGLGQSATFAVTLAQAPANNVTVSLASSDTSKVTISPASVIIAAGQTAPATQPSITGVNLGSATITASSAGYTNGTSTVQVNANVTFTQGITIIMGTGPQNLTLNLSTPACAGGIVVNLSSSNTAVATVPATATFTSGQSTVSVSVTPVATGTATIHASNLPNIPDATAGVTVAAPGTINLPSNAVVGLASSTPFNITLPTPAPSAVTIALASSDTTKVTISPASVNIAAGQTTPATQPTVHGVNLGTATINATAPGYTSNGVSVQVTATVTFTPPA